MESSTNTRPSTAASVSEALFAGLEANDDGAARLLYSLIRRSVFANVRGCSPDRLDDLTQDAWVTVYCAVHQRTILQPASLLLFTSSVVRHRRSDLISLLIRERFMDPSGLSSLEDQGEPLDSQIARAQLTQQIKRACASLPEHHRLILEDFYFHEIPREQTMARYNYTDNQYRNFKTRALQRLKKALSAGSVEALHD